MHMATRKRTSVSRPPTRGGSDASSIERATRAAFTDAASHLLERSKISEERYQRWQAIADRRGRKVEASSLSDDERRAHADWQELIGAMGRRYENASLANFSLYDPQRQLAAIERLANFIQHAHDFVNAGRSLVLWGEVGTGKDHLMAAAVREAVFTHFLQVRFVYGLKLYAEMREAIRRQQSEASVLVKYQTAPVLVISDPIPPTGGLSDYNVGTLLRLVHERYVEGRPTWLTINAPTFDAPHKGQSDDERKDSRVTEGLLSAPVFDRLCDGAVKIACQWDSYRQREWRDR